MYMNRTSLDRRYELKIKEYIITWVILPNKVVGVGGFRAAKVPGAFKLRWSKNDNVAVLDNQ